MAGLWVLCEIDRDFISLGAGLQGLKLEGCSTTVQERVSDA